MMTTNDLKKTTDWLKKNGVHFTVEDGVVHVDGVVAIPRGEVVRLPALAEVSGYVDVSENAAFTAPALVTIGHVAYNTEMFGHIIQVYDGIGTVTVSEKTRDGITIRSCRKAQFTDGNLVGENMYVVSKDEHNAHGETLSAALSDLAYKTADRDLSQYQNMPIDTVKTPYEWATAYRVVTGACQMGTEAFIKQQGGLKDAYTLSEIINITRGAFGSDRFRKVVGQ